MVVHQEEEEDMNQREQKIEGWKGRWIITNTSKTHKLTC